MRQRHKMTWQERRDIDVAYLTGEVTAPMMRLIQIADCLEDLRMKHRADQLRSIVLKLSNWQDKLWEIGAEE